MSDYDFTDEDGEGMAVFVDEDRNIFLEIHVAHDYAGQRIDPEKAREIARAFNAAADEAEAS